MDPSVQAGQHRQHQKDHNRAGNCGFIETNANGQANCCRSPQTCGSGQTFDLIAFGNNDGTCTQETDAADHLCAHSHRVAYGKYLIDVLVGNHNQAGAQAHQHICTQTGGAIFHAALQTDHTAQYQCHRNADSYSHHCQFPNFDLSHNAPPLKKIVNGIILDSFIIFNSYL